MKTIYKEQYRQIGLKIAYYRKFRGLTQEELAEQVGVTPAFIGHLGRQTSQSTVAGHAVRYCLRTGSFSP